MQTDLLLLHMHLVSLKQSLLLVFGLRIVMRATSMHLDTVRSWRNHSALRIEVPLLFLQLSLLLLMSLVLQILDLSIQFG